MDGAGNGCGCGWGWKWVCGWGWEWMWMGLEIGVWVGLGMDADRVGNAVGMWLGGTRTRLTTQTRPEPGGHRQPLRPGSRAGRPVSCSWGTGRCRFASRGHGGGGGRLSRRGGRGGAAGPAGAAGGAAVGAGAQVRRGDRGCSAWQPWLTPDSCLSPNPCLTTTLAVPSPSCPQTPASPNPSAWPLSSKKTPLPLFTVKRVMVKSWAEENDYWGIINNMGRVGKKCPQPDLMSPLITTGVLQDLKPIFLP